MKDAIGVTAVIAVVGAAFVGAMAFSMSAAGRQLPTEQAAPFQLSTPHHIECWNIKGEIIRSYDNDTRGPFFSTNGPIIFLDKHDHKMHRLNASNCDETWSPAESYH